VSFVFMAAIFRILGKQEKTAGSGADWRDDSILAATTWDVKATTNGILSTAKLAEAQVFAFLILIPDLRDLGK
jgi:hypothetical protein